MKTATLSVLALATLAACATTTQYTQWPYRGPMMMVHNPTTSTLVVMARDGTGRELVAARVEANSKQCFRWPFIHAIGYLVTADSRADTLTTEPFKPWSADGWEWTGGGQGEPVSNARVCR
ncbi:MAG: hypothetical protein ABR537_11510 [Gemmatimonadales bacterium]